MTQRRNDVDWLRVGATYVLFVFHTGKIFDPAPFFHVRNADLSPAFLVVCGFISLWHMPLFFLLAGWSIDASLAARGSREFLVERVRRLLVPLIAGSVLFGPLMKYVELCGGLDVSYAGIAVPAAPFHESFLEFLPTFFTRLSRFTWGHLWFLAYLFTFSVLYTPLFARARRSGLVLRSRGWVYAPLLPLVMIQLTLRPHWPGVQNLFDDWANVAYYGVYLWAGFLLARSPVLERTLHDEWPRALAVATGASLVLLLGVVGLVTSPATALAGSAVAGWCWVVAILGLGSRLRTSGGPALDYLRASAFPVYVLHQVAIVLIGYPIVHLPWGIAAKFATILVASLVATLAAYHLVVRRSAIVATLLGTAAVGRPGHMGPIAAGATGR